MHAVDYADPMFWAFLAAICLALVAVVLWRQIRRRQDLGHKHKRALDALAERRRGQAAGRLAPSAAPHGKVSVPATVQAPLPSQSFPPVTPPPLARATPAAQPSAAGDDKTRAVDAAAADADEQQLQQTDVVPADDVAQPSPWEGLSRSRAQLWGRLGELFAGRSGSIDAATLEACEDILLTSDVGVAMTGKIVDALRQAAQIAAEPLDAEDVRVLLRAQLEEALEPSSALSDPLAMAPQQDRPRIILFVGVNGVGKTTTIGKMASLLSLAGQKVVLAAGDTFRAAAAEQLGIWAERAQARLVRGDAGADPASVAFNAVDAAHKEQADVLLVDTAGRLHTQDDLMQEIRKVRRALSRQRASAPDETWLVVDATTGQNALQQAKAFHAALGLTGIVLTKLDGTARGGIVLAIVDALQLPVRFVGLGEQAADLRPFDAKAFVEALV